MEAPVRYAERGDARNATTDAISLTWPGLPIGLPGRSSSYASSSGMSVIGVAISPGATELTRMPSRASSRSEEHTSELQSRQYLVCRLLLEKKKRHGFNG